MVTGWVRRLVLGFCILIVAGCSGGGDGSTGDGGSLGNGTATTAPTGVVATAGDGQATISWDTVSGATSYNLYMASVSGMTKSNYGFLADGMKHESVTSPFTHIGLTNGKTYYFVVTAVNANGESSESSEVSATPVLSGTAPPAPTGVVVTPSDGQVTISWNPVSDATSYNLYMASVSGVNKNNYNSLTDGMIHEAVTSPFTHTGLTNGKTYYFVVTAVNTHGESVESAQVSAMPSASTPVLPDTRLFYKGDALWAVDPANPSTPVQFDSGTIGEREIYHGAWDATNSRVTALHKRTVVYAKDGRLYKVSALKDDTLTPTQVSSEADVTTLCNRGMVPDFAGQDNSVYLYEMPGPDSTCSTASDNILKMVRVGMNSTDNPIVAKQVMTTEPIFSNDRFMALWDKTSGAIIGWLAREGQNLVRCNQNFENCTALSPFATTIRNLGGNVFTGQIILLIDSNLHAYNISTGALSQSLYTSLGSTPTGGRSDATHLYFRDAGSILRVPLDGSAPASPLVTESGNLRFFNLTSNSVVYTVFSTSSTTTSLKVISKAGGTPSTLVPFTTDFTELEVVAGNWLYYQKGSTAGKIMDDGTGGTEIPNARWVGQIASADSSYSVPAFGSGSTFEIQTILWVEGCSISSCAGGTLKSLDAPTNTGEIVLGTLPSDISYIDFFEIGQNSLSYTALSAVVDILFIKADQANSLVRVTNTPTINELPVF